MNVMKPQEIGALARGLDRLVKVHEAAGTAEVFLRATVDELHAKGKVPSADYHHMMHQLDTLRAALDG